MRLFIGLKIPEVLTQNLQILQLGLRNARLSPPQNFHITLRFIGEIDNPQVVEIDTQLLKLISNDFSLKLSGVGFFGHDKPHSVHALVERNETLEILARRVEQICRKLGHEPETRKFTPHVTLAYLDKNSNLRDVLEWHARNNTFKSQEFEITQFHLFSSYLTKGASLYNEEASYDLRPNLDRNRANQ